MDELSPQASSKAPLRSPQLPSASPAKLPDIPDVMVVTGNTTHTQPENRAFYPALDGMRAIAFLMVFGQHYREMPWGWTGVDLFFVLSGFLITGILWDSRDDPHRVRNFYVRRTLRIFPLYYGVMLAILLLQPWAHWSWNWRWLAWPTYVGNYARFVHPYTSNSPLQQLADFQPHAVHARFKAVFYMGHFWSLCVEEQFYLFWPWIVFYVRSRRALLWICASSIVVCLGMRLAGQALLPPWMLYNEVLYRATPFRLDALLMGGLVALWLRGPQKELVLRMARYVGAGLAATVLLWLIFSRYGHLLSYPYTYPDWKFTWGLTAVDCIATVLVLLAIQPGTTVYRAFRLKPLRWAGRISYGAYVIHDMPHAFYVQYGVRFKHLDRATSLIALPCTFVLAWLSFRYLETPFLNLKERWTLRGPAPR